MCDIQGMAKTMVYTSRLQGMALKGLVEFWLTGRTVRRKSTVLRSYYVRGTRLQITWPKQVHC